MIVKNGTSIVFDVAGQTGEYIPRSVADVRQAAIDGLTPFFDVESVEVSSRSFLSDPLHYLSNWPYTAIVRATVQSDYSDIRDVDSIVAHAFYNGAGELPTVTARRYEQTPGAPESTSGLSLTAAIALVAVALVALAVVKVT